MCDEVTVFQSPSNALSEEEIVHRGRRRQTNLLERTKENE
jgi:hypothetical protein